MGYWGGEEISMSNFPLPTKTVAKILSGDLELEGDVFEALFAHYVEDMPYGTAKARTGDPDQFIMQRLKIEFPELPRL